MSMSRCKGAVPWLRTLRCTLRAATLFAVSGVVGCEADGVESSEPAIFVIQELVTFDPVPIGQSDVQVVEVRNDGLSDLTILGVDITGPSGAFEVRDADGLVIPPDESAFLQFVYNAATAEPVCGTAFFGTNVGDIEVELQATATAGLLEVSPNPVRFGRVAADTCKTLDLTLMNRGNVDLTVQSVVPFDPTEQFRLGLGSEWLLPVTLTPAGTDGASAIVEFLYCPEYEHPDWSLLTIRTQTANERSDVIIPVDANIDTPCISVTHEEGYSFGARLVGQTRSELFTLTNCSASDTGAPLTVESLAFAEPLDDAFALANVPALPLDLDPQQSTTFVVEYTAEALGASDRTVLRIVSSDTARTPLDIEITGLGSDNECPVPVIACTVARSGSPAGVDVWVYPSDPIACTAAGSFDNTAIAEYAWTVTSDPPGLVLALEGSAGPELTFETSSSGFYTVELNVIDDQGLPACAVATAEVMADTTEQFWLEFDWEAADSEGSGMVADVQLHLLDEGGCWGEAPLDCWAGNPAPVWGDPENVNDDPWFSRGRPSVRGQRWIRLRRPGPGTRRIGVHYNAAEGAAPIVARISLLFFGEFVLRSSRELSADARFWEVAVTSWPSATVTFTNAVYPTLEEAPCP